MRALIYSLAIFGMLFCSTCLSCGPEPSPFISEWDVEFSKPIPQYASTLFEDSIKLSFKETFESTIIRYTTNGRNPSKMSRIFENPMVLTESANIRAATFQYTAQQSESVAIDFLKAKKLRGVKSIEFDAPPSEKYAGNGAMALLDFEKGSFDFRSDKWMGFDDKVVTVRIELEEPIAIDSIIVSTISDNGAWIFLPKSIDVRTKTGTFKQSWDASQREEANRLAYLSVLLDGAPTKTLEININQLTELPAWHAGAGGQPWFFMDEIIIRQSNLTNEREFDSIR